MTESEMQASYCDVQTLSPPVGVMPGSGTPEWFDVEVIADRACFLVACAVGT